MVSSATRENPSDRHPDCPNCDSDVFVDAAKTDGEVYIYRLCKSRFGGDA